MLSRYHIGTRFRLVLLNHFLPYSNNDIVIDAGCGDGFITHWLSKQVKQVLGIDISNEVIKSNQKNLGYSKLKFKTMDLNDLSNQIKNNSVDSIISLDVLEHALNLKNILINFNKVTKTGGHLFILLPMDEHHGHLEVKDPQKLAKVIEQAGYEVKVVETCGYSAMRKLAANFIDGTRELMGYKMRDVDSFEETLSFELQQKDSPVLKLYKFGMTFINLGLKLDPQKYRKGDKEMLILAQKNKDM